MYEIFRTINSIYRIKDIKHTAYGSYYISTVRGLIRLSSHNQVSYRHTQQRCVSDLRFHMKVERVVEILKNIK